MVSLLINETDSPCAYKLCMEEVKLSRLLSTITMLYREKLYGYNSMIKMSGYYLKPFHIVIKKHRDGTKAYYYYGRYWYRLSSEGSKLRWYYVGSKKPIPDLPDPPINPLILMRVVNSNDESCLCILEYRKGDLELALEYVRKVLALLEGSGSKVLPDSLKIR